MRRYMKADLRRVYTRIPRLILLVVFYIAVLLTAFFSREDGMSTLDGFTNMGSLFGGILPVIIGVIELAFIYGDDFKAKTMQIAIGTGLPRQKVVHAKWLDFMFVTGIDMIIFVIVATISVVLTSAICGGLSAGFAMGNFIMQMVICWLSMVAYLGSVMFIMFWMQGISATLILYLLTATNVVSSAVQVISSLLRISRFHLHTYTLHGLINTFSARLVIGHISIGSLIGILLYMIISFALASILFKKKELEF